MKYLCFLLLLLFSFTSIGQADLLTKKERKYYFKGKTYDCNDLAPIYSQSPEAYKLYISGKNKRKAAGMFAITGVGFIVVGGIFALAGDFDISSFGGGAIVLGVVLENIAIIPALKGADKLNEALSIFNHDMIERHGYQSDTSLLFGFTNNGLGFVLEF